MMDRADIGSDDWWRAVRAAGTPLQRPLGDGQTALTFLWRDPAGGPAQSDCQRVYLDVYSHTPHPSERLTSMVRIAGSDAWMWQTKLPNDWCGSYFLMPASSAQLPPEQRSEVRRWWIGLMESAAIADPLNLHPPHGGGWGVPLSALRLPAAPEQPAWNGVLPGEGIGRHALNGNLQQRLWRSARLNNERRFWVYRTQSTQVAPMAEVPLVLLLDGHYWAQHMPIFHALDAMTAGGELPPALYLLIDAIDPGQRARELPCNPLFWQAVQAELLPEVGALHAFSADPRRTIVAGQSYGGLAALYAALYWPQRFGQVLSQSGSFWWPDAVRGGPPGQLTRQVLAGQGAGARLEVLLDIGCYETDMIEDNRAIHAALAAAGHRVRYREYRGGHDWLCWRDGLLDGLSQLLNHSPMEPQS